MKTFILSTTIFLLIWAPSAKSQPVLTCPVINDYIPVGQHFAVAPEPAYIAGEIPGSRVNVRTGPGAEYDAPAYGLVGDAVQVIGQAFSTECETWIQVRFLNSGHIGWLHSNYIGLYYERGWWD